MQTVPWVAFSCLDEDWNCLWLVVKLWYLAQKRYFEAQFRMCYNELAGLQNEKLFSVTPAGCGGLYPVLQA